MIRTGRVVPALLAAGAVLALSGCGATDRTAAATVDGVEIPADDFDALMEAYVARPDATTGDAASTGDALAGTDARNLLGQVIVGRLVESFLAERDAVPTDEELVAAPLEDWQAELPEGVRRPLAMFALGTEPLGPAVAAEAAERYDAPAGESGLLCPRLLVLETEQDALDVVTELEGGADAAALASERSIDETSSANGGVMADQSGAECLSASALSPDAPVGAAALALAPGEWSAPVTAQIDQAGTMGWFVVVARPYDEVTAEVNESVAGQVIGSYVDEIPVEVDPKLGRWDPEQFAVVAL